MAASMLVSMGLEANLAGDRGRFLLAGRMVVNTEVHQWIRDDGVGI